MRKDLQLSEICVCFSLEFDPNRLCDVIFFLLTDDEKKTANYQLV